MTDARSLGFIPAPPSVGARALRLGSGLVLGLFLLTHFTNLAFGLVSAQAMDAARPWLTGLWANPAGTTLLTGALALHFGLALRALYRRRTLRMSGREAAQAAFGLALPFLLVPHVVATAFVPQLTGRPIDFVHVVHNLWSSPPQGARQLAALAVGWLHGCLGVWFWLRAKPWFPRAAPYLLVLALLLPFSAALGFAEAGRGLARVPPEPYAVTAAVAARGARAEAIGLAALGAAVAAAFLLRAARDWLGRGRRVRVRYPDGRVCTVPAGFSVLEASRLGRIPHVSVCGGRGRCSTCQVRILSGREHLPEPSGVERATLAQVAADADVRLACQLRPMRDLSVSPIYAHPPNRAGAILDLDALPSGREREIAVLFCDLRGFTRRSERALPFDTVHLLNRYFAVVGEAVAGSGGYLDKFIGDGALALFGLDGPPERACRQALAAAGLIARGLDGLNARLRAEGGQPVRVAMGLHVGLCIVGEIGHGRAMGLTAVGDGINVASRLEGAAKEAEVEAVISVDLMERAGFEAASVFARQALSIRGRSRPLDVVLVPDALALAELRAEA